MRIAIKKVQPRNVATYQAVQMVADHSAVVAELALQAGARVQGWRIVKRKGASVSVFRIIGKNRKTYDLAVGDWLIILGDNGSIRACTNNQYLRDYRETDSE